MIVSFLLCAQVRVSTYNSERQAAPVRRRIKGTIPAWEDAGARHIRGYGPPCACHHTPTVPLIARGTMRLLLLTFLHFAAAGSRGAMRHYREEAVSSYGMSGIHTLHSNVLETCTSTTTSPHLDTDRHELTGSASYPESGTATPGVVRMNYQVLSHPAFPRHSIRIKRSDFCDGTVGYAVHRVAYPHADSVHREEHIQDISISMLGICSSTSSRVGGIQRRMISYPG